MQSHVASDRAFCQAILPEVSRTFALSIEALPDGLRDAVRIAYLLCRMVDTVEDAAGIWPNQRELLFDAFEGLVTGGLKQAALFAQAADEAGLGEGTADSRLCAAAERVARTFSSLPAAQQAVIRPPVRAMAEGMRQTCRRAAADGRLRLTDVADLEQYCYFVAGTVGELLTGLFQAAVPDLTPATRGALRARAVSFGTGLQLVNILKDVAEDARRGVTYLPVALADAENLSLDRLLEPDQREAGLRVLRRLTALARDHLRRAAEYTLLWPTTDPSGLAVRQFCAVPLALALATLDLIESGRDVLSPGRTPKLDRATVARVVAEVISAASDDTRLAALLAD